MDPVARRFMWNVIMRIVTERRECAMILTTHRRVVAQPHRHIYMSSRHFPSRVFLSRECGMPADHRAVSLRGTTAEVLCDCGCSRSSGGLAQIHLHSMYIL